MKSVSGKTAFVTGAANGIGLGMARSLARAGANVAIADVDAESLHVAQADVAQFGTQVIAMSVDVSDQAAVEQAAEAVERALGPVHLLFNNAGITLGGLGITEIERNQWDWIFGVNVFGAVHGIKAFVPRMLAHDEESHVVNTASMGGLMFSPDLRNPSYAMTKYAVVAMSEALEHELADTNIGVSVLCPAAVRSTLGHSMKRRPERFGGPIEPAGSAESRAVNMRSEVLDPDEVGERVLSAIYAEEFFILTHESPRPAIEQRHARIMAAFDRVEEYNKSR